MFGSLMPPVLLEYPLYKTVCSSVSAPASKGSFHSAESVGLQTLKAQTQVLSGEYHYEKNLIVLKVERKTMGADGRFEPPTFEDVCYEVVSLNIKETEGDAPLELLGARTESAIKPLMNELIKSFVGLEDAHSLLQTSITQGADESDEYASAKGQLKSITLPVSGGGESRLDILDTYISKVGRQLDYRAQDQLATPKIQNFQVLKHLLSQGPFKSLIETAKTTHEKSHKYVSNHPVMKDKTELLEEMSAALFERGDEAPSIFQYVERISVEECEKQQDSLFAAQPIFEKFKDRLEAKIQEVEKMQQDSPNDAQAVRLQEYKGNLAEVNAKIEKIKSEIKHTQDLSSLVRFVKEKKVQDQRASFGSTAFTELHSEQWYRKLDSLGLLDLEHWIDCVGESEAELRKKARTILGKNFEKRVPDIFGDFLGELERLQAMLKVEIDRPLDGLDPLHTLDALADGSDDAVSLSDVDLDELRRSMSPLPRDSREGSTALLGARFKEVSAVLNRVPAPDVASVAGHASKGVVSVVDATDSDQAARVAALREKLEIEVRQSKIGEERAVRKARVAKIIKDHRAASVEFKHEVAQGPRSVEEKRAARRARIADLRLPNASETPSVEVEDGVEAIRAKRLDGPAVVSVDSGSALANLDGLKVTSTAFALMKAINAKGDPLSSNA